MQDGSEAWRKQTHDDLGSLSARVASTERGIANLAHGFDELRRDTTAQFAVVGKSIADVADKLSTKIDSVNTATLSSRNTNWTAFWGSAAAVATVIIGLGGAVIWPINVSLNQLSAHLDKVDDKSLNKEDFNQYRSEIKDWAASLRDRLRADEDRNAREDQRFAELKGKVEAQMEATQREITRLLSRMDAKPTFPP